MVTEIAILQIDPTQCEGFERTYRDVVHILQRQPGYQSERLMRSLEDPGQYILAVEWDSKEDHLRFIDAPDYPDLDGALGNYVKDAAVAHYRKIN
jgi:heme-degrading monooxygenase HmoA